MTEDDYYHINDEDHATGLQEVVIVTASAQHYYNKRNSLLRLLVGPIQTLLGGILSTYMMSNLLAHISAYLWYIMCYIKDGEWLEVPNQMLKNLNENIEIPHEGNIGFIKNMLGRWFGIGGYYSPDTSSKLNLNWALKYTQLETLLNLDMAAMKEWITSVVNVSNQ